MNSSENDIQQQIEAYVQGRERVVMSDLLAEVRPTSGEYPGSAVRAVVAACLSQIGWEDGGATREGRYWMKRCNTAYPAKVGGGEDWFAEKIHQVDGPAIKAFGIELVSRYGKAWELRELLDFAEKAALLSVERYVKRAFYDSKANLCTFELVREVRDVDPAGFALMSVARETISQFEMFGYVDGSGRHFDQEEEGQPTG